MNLLYKTKIGFNVIEIYDDRIVTRDFFKREKSIMVDKIARLDPGLPGVGIIRIELVGGQKLKLVMRSKDKQPILDAIYQAQRNFSQN